MCKYVYSQIWSFLTWERLRIVAEQEEEEEEDEGGAEQRQCANKAWIPVIWDFHSFDFRFEIAPVITCDWSTPFWKGINDHRTYNLHCPWERILKNTISFRHCPNYPCPLHAIWATFSLSKSVKINLGNAQKKGCFSGIPSLSVVSNSSTYTGIWIFS